MKRELTLKQLAQLKKFGYIKLMERLKELLTQQKERREGGNKWIGTSGRSLFGNGDTNPAGTGGGNRTAVKVWDARGYDGKRNIKIALRRLRKFVRSRIAEELALDELIRVTAKNAGYLDIKIRT